MTKPHWSATAVGNAVAREEAEAEQARKALLALTALQRAAATEGLMCVDRVEAELQTIAKTFNASIGRSVLDVRRSPAGTVSLSHRLRQTYYVVFVFHLTTADGEAYVEREPYVSVDVHHGGSGYRTPHAFTLQGEHDRLHIEHAGQALGPEQFVRVHVEPWLAQVPGRDR